MASILKTIAQDLNRSLLHGARQADENGTPLPSTMLDGRQAATTMPQLQAGVAVTLQVDGTTIQANLVPQAGDIEPVNTAVRTALENDQQYFQLEEEKQLPTWICQQKLFSLPDRPVPEDLASYDKEGVAMKLLRLPPAVLHENATHKRSVDDPIPAPAPVSLCRVWQEKKGNASYQKLVPLPPDKWQPAILVRCPMNPAWSSGTTETPVFELKGVPQDQRWYLDQLNLLPPMSNNGNLPKEAELKIWVEKPALEGQPPPRIEFKDWVIARRNLTVLARPGESQLQDDEVQPVPYPYAVTEDDVVNTIRLVQMGSITNSGGYYFRPYFRDGEQKSSFEHGKHILVVAILLPVNPSGGESQALPLAANAAAFPAQKQYDPGFDPKQPKEPAVVRFEGEQHMVIEPYTPTGCVSFGWRRVLPKLVTNNPTEELKPSHPVGFARSIHLLDFEVKGSDGELLKHYREVIVWKNDPAAPLGKTPGRQWVTEDCRGDSSPALSPVKRLHGQTDGGSEALPWVVLDSEPEPESDKADNEPPVPDLYFYRNTLRLATEDEGFSYLSDTARQTLSVSAAYRDIFGNRLLPGQGKHKRALSYSDALIPPGEWPGFTFRMFPSSTGVVTLEAIFRKPEVSEKDKLDVIRKLTRIKAQLDGATADDVAVSLVDAAAGDSPFKFTPGTTSLKAGLQALLVKAVAWEEVPEAVPFPFAVSFNATGTNGGRPSVFSPLLLIERTKAQFHPNFNELLGPGESFVKSSIRTQIVRCHHAILLAANAFEDDPKPPADENAPTVQSPTFRDVAMKFSQHLSAGFRTQAAGRRNRFNEHELWFVPNALFPKTRAGEPLFSTPRPLSTTRGTESFQVPDFFVSPLPTPVPEHWRDLPRKQTGVTCADYDLLGRRAFELVDQLAQPLELTQRTFAKNPAGADTPELLWNAILSGKDDVAKTLGDASRGFVVPIFDKTELMPKGVTRMCQDAFQRDLRLFYGIDALVQWPVELPVVLQTEKPVINFYGVSKATILSADVGTKPTFSDFVLNPADDAASSADAAANNPRLDGYLTVTYDLPPDGEKNFTAWTTRDFTARITHLQLPTADKIESRVFNQGQWLELVGIDLDGDGHGDTDGDKVPILFYTPSNLKVPAVLRRFPDEPVMPSCKSLSPKADSLPTEHLALWGWEVKFDVEKTSTDTIYLEVEYSDPAKPAPADVADDADEWPSTSLLQDLVVLGQLANQPLSWWSDTASTGPVAMQAFPPLLRSLNKHLTSKPTTLADDPSKPAVKDHFSCAIDSLSHTPKEIKNTNNPSRKRVVAQIDDEKDQSPPGAGMTRFVVTAEADGSADNGILSLFGDNSATAFRPNLRLKRNDRIMGREATTSLVYECGPVYYPELLRTANRYSTPIRAATIPLDDTFNKDALAAQVKAVLERVLGTRLGDYYHLRVDCKHSYAVGTKHLTNAFLILPVDYGYTTVDALATELADRYVGFLQGNAKDVLRSITSPSFVLGLQVTSKKDQHVLLEIDALQFAFIP